jgi:hypothetical protein
VDIVPKIHIKNRTTRDLFIDSNDDWDDQVLLVSGKVLHGQHKVAKGSHATISQKGWTDAGDCRMGVDVTEGREGGYQMTIGQTPDLGVIEMTRYGEVHVAYTISDQAPSEITMTFADGEPNPEVYGE